MNFFHFEWIFSITPMTTLSLFVSITALSNIGYFSLYSFDMLCLLQNFYSFSRQIIWIINHLKLCNPLLEYTDDKCHQELSAEKCNQEPLTEKSHEESTKSTNGILTLFSLLLGTYKVEFSLVAGMGGPPPPLPPSKKKVSKFSGEIPLYNYWKIRHFWASKSRKTETFCLWQVPSF